MRLIVFIALLLSFELYSQDFKYNSNATIEGVGNSTSLIFDVNNDGYDDILISGKSGTNYYSKIYKNNSDSTFLDIGVPFTGVAYGDADAFDFNNDSLIDIALSGTDGSNKIFKLYKNIGNNLFEEIAVPIPGVDYSNIECADFNRDGYIDILVMGQSNAAKITYLYSNNGDGTFSLKCTFEGLYDGSLVVADINNDSYPDIIATGVDNSFNLLHKIYINSANGEISFSERLSNITPVRGGTMKAIDYDNDGYKDILISGKNSDDEYVTKIYKNNMGGSFVHSTDLTGLYYASSLICDFNNNGFSDILLTGLDINSDYKTIYYTNNSGTGFIEQATNLPDVIKGSLSSFELRDDSKQDMFISGYLMSGPVSQVFSNNTIVVNTKPQIPSGLTSLAEDDSVLLSWTAPIDAETASSGLTYSFYIKRADNGDTLFSSPSSFSTGDLFINKQGTIEGTSVALKNLSYGKYYWNVQAIDPAFQTSSFAAEQEFNICHTISLGKDTSICKYDSVELSIGNPTDIVDWYSSVSPSVAFHQGNDVKIEMLDTIIVWAEVSTSIGCTLIDTIKLNALPLPITSFTEDTSVCPGTELNFSLAHEGYLGNWTSFSGDITQNISNFIQFEANNNETIYVEILDTNGCVNYDTLQIAILPLPVNNLPLDTITCYNDSISLFAGIALDVVNWYDENMQNILTGNLIKHHAIDTSKLYYTIKGTNNCEINDSITIKALPLPMVEAGYDTIICPETSVRIGSSPISKYLYEWLPSHSLNNNILAQPIASPEILTKYILTVTDTNSCTNTDSVTITINSPTVINIGEDKMICLGDKIELGGHPVASGSLIPYKYQWIPGTGMSDNTIANPLVSPETTTNYSLVVFTAECVVDTVNVQVKVNPLPVITNSGDVTIGFGENIQIEAFGGEKYEWQPALGLNNNLVQNPVASPETTTIYTVFATDTNACESYSDLLLTVENEIFVPNLFTPNGDGNNDYFRIYGMGIGQIELKIYNHLGILVWETDNVEEAINIGWDGNYLGKPLEAGRYLWVLEAKSTTGETLTYQGKNKGVITILH